MVSEIVIVKTLLKKRFWLGFEFLGIILGLTFVVNLVLGENSGFHQVDFDEYELNGEVVLGDMVDGDLKSSNASKVFSVFVRGTEWRIEVSDRLKNRNASVIVDDEVWYGDGEAVFQQERAFGNWSDHLNIFPKRFPVSTDPGSTVPILWVMFASRDLLHQTSLARMPLLHDWEAWPICGDGINLDCRTLYGSKLSSFPTNVTYFLDLISDDEEDRLSNETPDGEVSHGVYRTSNKQDRTNACYQAYSSKTVEDRIVPTGFQFHDRLKLSWGWKTQLSRQGNATVQRFSPKCSLKDLKPQIRRETGVGDMRLWVESPPVFKEGQGVDIPTYTLMPGEDWPTLEQAKIRLKHPDRDRRTKPQPWGFVLLGVMLGVPLFWAARRSFRRA